MGGGGVAGEATKERIAEMVHKAKAGGGCLGKDARALSAQILQHYQVPLLNPKQPTRTPMVAKWENELFVKYLVPAEGR